MMTRERKVISQNKPEWDQLKVGVKVLDLHQEPLKADGRAKKKEWPGKIIKLNEDTKKIHIAFESARDGRPYELVTELRFYGKSWRLK